MIKKIALWWAKFLLIRAKFAILTIPLIIFFVLPNVPAGRQVWGALDRAKADFRLAKICDDSIKTQQRDLDRRDFRAYERDESSTCARAIHVQSLPMHAYMRELLCPTPIDCDPAHVIKEIKTHEKV